MSVGLAVGQSVGRLFVWLFGQMNLGMYSNSLNPDCGGWLAGIPVFTGYRTGVRVNAATHGL